MKVYSAAVWRQFLKIQIIDTIGLKLKKYMVHVLQKQINFKFLD